MSFELYRVRWFIEEHRTLLLAFIAVCLVLFIAGMGLASYKEPTPIPAPTTAPIIIVNASPTAIVNASTPTPTPNATAHPTALPMTFDEYIRALEAFYGKSEPPWTDKSFIDPLSPEGYQRYLEWSEIPANVRPFDGTEFGVRVYGSPTPTPAPTPKPYDPFDRETHTYIIDTGLADLQVNAMMSGYLSIADTRGVYNYYHPGDYAVVELDFINTNIDTVVNPIVKVEFNKTDSYGNIIPWIKNENEYQYTIPEAKWNYDHTVCEQPTSFKYVYEIGLIPNVIPDNGVLKDSKGTYQVSVTIYNHEKSLVLCWVSWQVNIT